MSIRSTRTTTTLAALGLFALTGVPLAHAADAVMEEPPAPAAEQLPVASWTGAYGGATAGYGFAGTSKDEASDNRIDTDGFVAHGFLGYNQEVGSGMVAGVEGDLGYSGVKGEDAGAKVRSGADGSLRARLGYTVTPEALLYVTGGGAAKTMSVEEGGEKDKQTQLGYTAGVGADVKLTDKVFARAEYRYSDYGSDSFSTGSGDRDVDAKDHRIQLGLGIQF